MIKVLVVLVNYGEEQLNYLQQVVTEFKSFKKYKVFIVVHSNIPLEGIKGIDETFVVELEDYQLLPMTCRQTIDDNSKDYDYYIFSENDHLWKEYHIDNYIEYEKILPLDRVAGLIQYEENDTGRFYPAYHAHYEWDWDSVEEYGNKKFAHFTNIHQASFILSKEKLAQIKEQQDFTQFFSNDHYSVKCKTNTDIYGHAGMKKLICISEFESNLIHHLPNIYINGDSGRNMLGSNEDRMQFSIKTLLQ
tara:strand:+ start:1027 stop:1770 length:744 start_codon:yes stop_codon:yes gene_type:complete